MCDSPEAQEAIAQADAYLNNVALPNYTELVGQLTALQRAAEQALTALKGYRSQNVVAIKSLEAALQSIQVK